MLETLPIQSPALGLAAFVRDLVAYAPRRDEDAARRALCSPYAGLSNADARALCAVAGERRSVVETIAARRISLSHAASRAAAMFRACARRARTGVRAQGATARDYLATIALAFDFSQRLDDRERATFQTLQTLAGGLDSSGTADAFDASIFVAALEDYGRQARGRRSATRSERVDQARAPRDQTLLEAPALSAKI